MNKDAVYPYRGDTRFICREMGDIILVRCPNIQFVIAPAIGGVRLADGVADYLEARTGRKIISIVTEKGPKGEQVLERGQGELIKGLVGAGLEDVTTSGGSISQTVGCAHANGGEIMAVIAICNRGGVTAEAVGGVPIFEWLFDWPKELDDIRTWEEDQCELCATDVPVNTNVGKGREFLERKDAEKAAVPA